MKGFEASVIRSIARGVFDSKQEAAVETAHWGLEDGPYLWEVVTDGKRQKTLSYQRLAEWQKWTPDVDHQHIGFTICSDMEIDSLGEYNLLSILLVGHFLE